jgi:hypothetical protein
MAIVSFRYTLSRRAVLHVKTSHYEDEPPRADALQSTHSIADRFGMARALVCGASGAPARRDDLTRQP